LVSFAGGALKRQTGEPSEALVERILDFCKSIAGDSEVTAICMCSESTLGLSVDGKTAEVLLVIRGFQPRLRYHLKSFESQTVAVVAVDQWVFERDVDRGFLGEALAGGLIFPYNALVNTSYSHIQEVKLKKRIALELLENIVASFPELSYEMRIKPEYFMYEAMLARARLFPPTMYGSLRFMQEEGKKGRTGHVLDGYVEALDELCRTGIVTRSDGYIRLSQSFVDDLKKRKVRFASLVKPAQRTLFASLVGAFPRIMTFFSQNREILLGFQRFIQGNSRIVPKLEFPERYLFVPTTAGLVPLANKMDIEIFARKVLSTSEDAHVEVKAIGGVLNDVYLITASNDVEERVVVKRFKDWSSIKWFPLTLWTVGTRTFAVLGRSRLEREVAISRLLDSKGFNVPKVIHVNAEERLVFMEFLEGENMGNVVRRVATAQSLSEAKKDLKTIERVGRKLSKVHALGIALGDTKPENALINKFGEICLMDFEQAARGGDRVWDVAEFLYYAGHLLPPLVDARVAERIGEAFVSGYLKGGGKVETVKKVATAKYTKVFSVFTLPHVMLAMSNVCRRAEKLKV